MRIFQTILYQYIFGYIIQGFAYSLGIYAFCQQKVELKKYISVSILLIIISIITRTIIMSLMPQIFGIHTILDLVFLFLLGIFFLKISAFRMFRSILAITVLLIMTELISVFFLTFILGQATVDSMMKDSVGAAIIALPSSVLFAILIVSSYFILIKMKMKKSAINGEGSK